MAAGIPVSRVVAVVAALDTGKTQIGSGYLLDARRVLTALHCIMDKETGHAAVRLSVIRANKSRDTATAALAEASPTLDVAVLAIEPGSPWGDELPGAAVIFGRVDREYAAQLYDCEAVGYPLWQSDDEGKYRDLAELHGYIRALEGRESQRLVLRDPILASVTSAHREVVAADATTCERPIWGGLSGAAVFYRGLLLGIIIEHHPQQGETSLQIRPIDAIAAGTDDSTVRLGKVLGLGEPGAFLEISDERTVAQIRELFDNDLKPAPPSDATVGELIVLSGEYELESRDAPLSQQVVQMASQEMPGFPVEPGYSERCVRVTLQRDFYSNQYRMFVDLYRDGRNAVPQECDGDSAPLAEIKARLRRLLPDIAQGLQIALVEFAVPEDLLGKDFDQWPLASYPGAPAKTDFRLGERYPVVVRDSNHQKFHPELWQSRWRRLLTCDGPAKEAVFWVTLQPKTPFRTMRATLIHPDTHEQVILALRPARVRGDVLDEMVDAGVAAGVPAAIWMRRQHAAQISIEDDLDYLEKAMGEGALCSLPQRLQHLRLRAEEEQGKVFHPGRRLSLAWADPTRCWNPPPFEDPALSVSEKDE